jgi:superoxide reductase
MIERKQIYRCNTCGNIVEVMHAGGGTLVCCGNEMELLDETPLVEGAEKHVPVIEKTGKGVKIKVGSLKHPMEENHYIEWIEVVVDDRVYRKFLKPGGEPEAEFEVEASGNIKAREYCTVHGLWGSSI